MEMPRIGTRKANRTTKPGVNAGVAKGVRGTKAAQAESRLEKEQAAATQASRAAAKQNKDRERLAALEDEQHRQDLVYAETANHPIDPPTKFRTQEADTVDAGSMDVVGGNKSGSGDDSEPYQPAADASESSESDTSDSEEDQPPKKKKKSKLLPTTRADIISSRKSQDSTGTPKVTPAEPGSKKRKRSKDKKADKKKPKKSGLAKAKSVAGSSAAASNDDDSMVRMGGPAVDDDTAEHVEKPKSGKKKMGIPNALITIQPVAPKALSRKEIRGGDKKWGLKHLPAGTADEFTNEVIPLTRQLLGTLPAWEGLTVKQIQQIVDDVYGAGKYVVTPDGVWYGLVGYRSSDWRSGIAAQALKGIEQIIEAYNNPPSDGEDDSDADEDEDIGMSDPAAAEGVSVPPAVNPAPVTPAADATATPTVPLAGNATAAATVIAAVPEFTFDTPEGIAKFVRFCLQRHDGSGTMAFHWKVWGSGTEKQGFLQSRLIAYTFAYHLTQLDTIPGGYPKIDAPPVGALLLSVQAVQRALQFWQTGQYVHPSKPTGSFSFDNWGDYATAADPRHPKSKHAKLIRRATKFLSSVKNWDTTHWEQLEKAARKYVEQPTRKHGASSRSTSEASDGDVEEDDDVIVLSD